MTRPAPSAATAWVASSSKRVMTPMASSLLTRLATAVVNAALGLAAVSEGFTGVTPEVEAPGDDLRGNVLQGGVMGKCMRPQDGERVTCRDA